MDIIYYTLESWNTKEEYRNAWNQILVQLEGNERFIQCNEVKRNFVLKTLRNIRNHYDCPYSKIHLQIQSNCRLIIRSPDTNQTEWTSVQIACGAMVSTILFTMGIAFFIAIYYSLYSYFLQND